MPFWKTSLASEVVVRIFNLRCILVDIIELPKCAVIYNTIKLFFIRVDGLMVLYLFLVSSNIV